MALNKNLIKRSLLEVFNKYGYGRDGLELIKRLGILAGSIGYNSFLIGGFVRDIIIYSMKINPETSSRFASSKVFNISKKEIEQDTRLDIDIVLEGNAERFAESIRERNDIGFAINSIKIHKRFRTASVEFLINKKPLKVDLASARTETYLNHGALPAVSIGGASLKDDVSRRDFTINTIAFSLNTDGSSNGSGLPGGVHIGARRLRAFLAVKDYAGGLSDILNKKIRVLHDLSFKEDPTRIFRAVRFEKRLGFSIERHTGTLIKNALDARVLDNISGKRITAELNLLLKEKNPEIYLARLEALGVLKGIYSKLGFNESNERVFRKIAKSCKTSKNTHIFYIAELLHHLNKAEFNAAIERLALGEKIKQTISSMYLEAKSLASLFSELDEVKKKCADKLCEDKLLKLKNSEIYLMFKGFSEGGILFYFFKNNNKGELALNFAKWAEKFINKIRFIKPAISGNDIKSFGICEGPVCGSILEEIKLLKMDGKLKSKDAEVLYVKNKYIVKKMEGLKNDRV
ncbi:MAG: hypothetical protein M0016_02260 [Deltaproteobacteria bacterium]|jgi:tRNA nucleotidyltransferase (CCA-adding enzyme)|nr:hypothetical protein [Deltaproteobacteria bacterium]MCL5880295.1 hypothetical protein [Deltaproteobacteria bacterium]MDA8303971.1 hypothetical protein [Deltaproteobacteria bacterium]